MRARLPTSGARWSEWGCRAGSEGLPRETKVNETYFRPVGDAKACEEVLEVVERRKDALSQVSSHISPVKNGWGCR